LGAVGSSSGSTGYDPDSIVSRVVFDLDDEPALLGGWRESEQVAEFDLF
jgi:hypothetical protein